MSGNIWASSYIFDGGGHFKFRDTTVSPESESRHDVKYKDLNSYALKRARGEYVSPSETEVFVPELITKVYKGEAYKHAGKRLDEGGFPDLTNFFACIVSPKFKQTVEAFDLGKSYFLPVRVHFRASKTETKIYDHFYFHPCGQKKTVNAEESPAVTVNRLAGFKKLRPENKKDGENSITYKSALEGQDIWADPAVIGSIFFSDRLARALIEADVGNELNLIETVTR